MVPKPLLEDINAKDAPNAVRNRNIINNTINNNIFKIVCHTIHHTRLNLENAVLKKSV